MTRSLSIPNSDDSWKIELKTTIKVYYKDYFLDSNEKREIKMLLFDHQKNSNDLFGVLREMGWSPEEWQRGFKEQDAFRNLPCCSPEPG